MKQIKPKTSKGPAEWFTGDVYPTILLSGEEPSRVRLGSVHFSPELALLGTPTPSANTYTLLKGLRSCRSAAVRSLF